MGSLRTAMLAGALVLPAALHAAQYSVNTTSTATQTLQATGPTLPDANLSWSFTMPLPAIPPFNAALGTLVSVETQFAPNATLRGTGSFFANAIDPTGDPEANFSAVVDVAFGGAITYTSLDIGALSGGCNTNAPGAFSCTDSRSVGFPTYMGPPPLPYVDPMPVTISGSVNVAPRHADTDFVALDLAVDTLLVAVTTYTYLPAGAPTANAGADQTVEAGTVVQLDGTASSDDTTPTASLQYSWSFAQRPTGSTATLVGANTATPSFVADRNQNGGCDYRISLVVTDGDSNASNSDEVRVCTINTPPTAEAGANQSIHAGQLVQLNGTGSSDPVTPTESLQYAWTLTQRPTGSIAALANAATATPSFTADRVGDYEATLVVRDQFNTASAPDTVTVSSLNSPPNADAGLDQSVQAGDTVTLDGSGSSDPDMDGLSFVWQLTSRPLNSDATLSDPGAQMPTFLADQPGSYEASLVVSDGFANSAPETVSVVAINPATAEQKLGEALTAIANLPVGNFTSKGNKKQLIKLVEQAINKVQAGKTAQAIAKVNAALVRTDGCALRGAPDTQGGANRPAKDYINNCSAQAQVYPLLAEAQALLE